LAFSRHGRINMGKPWIEDAKDYQVIDELADAGIHQTSTIREYLAYENTQRTIVLAPKGCGKTLLIKHKRKSLQNRGFEMLPNNQLVSLAPGYAPPFDDDRTRHIRESPQYWSTLWQIALSIAVLRAERTPSFDLTMSATSALRSIVENEQLVDPFHIFVQLLYFQPREFFDAVREFQARLLPAFSRAHSQVALFIDNVDECFGHHLTREKRSGLHGQIANEFWHDAQVGLLMAVRQISGHNPHVKVFATIRTEAFSARQAAIPDLANVRAHMVTIKFDYDDLRHIFVENINQESQDRLVEPHSPDPFRRFVGAGAVAIRHLYTGKLEHIFDYIHRHTFGRPRDYMTIGREISALRRERRTPDEVRMAVNRAAVEIAKSYLTEVSPHFNWFDEDIMFSSLKANSFDSEQFRRLARSYDASARKLETPWRAEGNGGTALADMYASGLIGITRPHSVTPGQIQHFESVFDLNSSVTRQRQELPVSKNYLAHNVLGSYLRHRYTPDRWRAHRVNIISPEQKWIEPDGLMYVMQLDICDSEAIRGDPVRASAFRPMLDAIVEEVLDGIDHHENVGGDGVAFADRNGYILVRAAERMAVALKNSLLNASIRVGLDFGPVMLGKKLGNDGKRFEQGQPVTRSARLQGASAPGHLLTLPAVAETLAEYQINWPFFDLAPHHPGFLAKKSERGWSIQEKAKPAEAEQFERLVALPLHDLKID
jgi:hypothetical protein